MLESEVNNREIIYAEIKAKQAEEEENSPEFQAAMTNDAKTQKSKTKDGKGGKNSGKAISKKQAKPKTSKKAETIEENKTTNKGESKTKKPLKLDKATEDLFVAMDNLTGDNVKKSDHQQPKEQVSTPPDEAQSEPGAPVSIGTETNQEINNDGSKAHEKEVEEKAQEEAQSEPGATASVGTVTNNN